MLNDSKHSLFHDTTQTLDETTSLFTHIYIETKARNHKRTKQILEQFPNAVLIEITHYKDIFNRSHQNYPLQKQHKNLILAVKEHQLIYEGAPVCQNFGNTHFYYTSSMMNCIYDCEYCYLQGMYPSANVVVFVNLEDIFTQVKSLLSKHPIYLCISYDTDLLAMEQILGYVRAWLEFARTQEGLTIELRTKSANFTAIQDCMPLDRFLLAWTLSPETIVTSYEHLTPSLESRLKAIKTAQESGWNVRLCFDPIIDINDWNVCYQHMLDTVCSYVKMDDIYDVSIGVFRVSSGYLKTMKRQRPDSVIIQYPYENDHGVSHYGTIRSNELITTMKQKLEHIVPEEKIFIWKENEK